MHILSSKYIWYFENFLLFCYSLIRLKLMSVSVGDRFIQEYLITKDIFSKDSDGFFLILG